MAVLHEDLGSKEVKAPLLTLNLSMIRVFSFTLQSPLLSVEHSCSVLDKGAVWAPKPHVDVKVHFHVPVLCIVYRLSSL
jgi:hypothetical protein